MSRRSSRLANRAFSMLEERPLLVESSDEGSDGESCASDGFDGEFSDVDAEGNARPFNSDSEDEAEENVQHIPPQRTEQATFYFAQNPKRSQRKWSSKPPNTHKIPVSHLLRERQGITARTTQAINTKLDAFKQVVPEVLVQIIVRETNKKAHRFYTQLKQEHPNDKPRKWRDTDVHEIYALIGILIFVGAHKQWNENLEELFDMENRPFCRAVMCLDRAQQLLRFLRFDDQTTRSNRLKTDRLAAFRDVWNIFGEQLESVYKPSANLTIDEQLVAFRGRCSFKQYIPSKPDRYGIKILWITDAENNFPLKGEIYVGKQPNEEVAVNYGCNLVQRLSARYLNKGRTITMDNFFTSCDLAERLLEKNTTMIGTIRSVKPDLPAEFSKKEFIQQREIGSSLFCFDNMLTLVSYVPKKNKNVLLLSTAHNTNGVDEKTKKPYIILDYNSTKSGVDTLDYLVKAYTCRRITKRWPLALFFNLINIAGVAAYRLYGFSQPDWMQQSECEPYFFVYFMN